MFGVTAEHRDYDAILIPGGGLLTVEGAEPALYPWVRARLDRALEHSAAYYIALSAGTAHKPMPRDAQGRPVYESVVAAEYLRQRGIPEQRILAETSSYDTIGNAWFARLLFAEPLGLRRLLIVTSAFHMERTEAIFRWVFGLESHADYDLAFEATADAGIEPDVLEARRVRERASLASVRAVEKRVRTVAAFHEWLYAEHEAYAWFLRQSGFKPIDGAIAGTY